MQSALDICNKNIYNLFSLISKIDEISKHNLSNNDRENLDIFMETFSVMKSYDARDSIEVGNVITYAKKAAFHAQALGFGLSRNSDDTSNLKSLGLDLMNHAASFLEEMESRPELKEAYILSIKAQNRLRHNSEDNENHLPSRHESNLIAIQEKIRANIESFERDISKGIDEIHNIKLQSSNNFQQSKKEISDLSHTTEQLKNEISNLHKYILSESKKALEFTEAASERSKELNTKADELLGDAAAKVLLLDYAETADTEKKSADSMRFWSLVCMGLTGVILCYSIYESLEGDFDWKQSIFKMLIALTLSVPAAYLARESAKHRSQQHISRRISLDLRAITPYIASLPESEQNKIKSEVASKIFGVQSNENSSDNYPINIQEVLLSIIEKIPTKKD